MLSEEDKKFIMSLLNFNHPTIKSIGSGEVHSYEIHIFQDQFLEVSLEQRGVDLLIDLYKRSEHLLTVGGLAFNYLIKNFYWLAKKNTLLQVNIRTREKHSSLGSYSITVCQLRTKKSSDMDYIEFQKLFTETMAMCSDASIISKQKAVGNLVLLLDKVKLLNHIEKQFELLILISNLCKFLGQQQKALSYLKEALDLANKQNNPYKKSLCLNNVGNIHSLINSQEAFEYFQQALDIANQAEDLFGEATVLCNLGAHFNRLEQRKKALSYYKEAYFLAEQCKNEYLQMVLLNNIGTIVSLDNKDEGLEYYQRALAIRTDPVNQISVLKNIGNVYKASGEFEEALNYYNQSLDIINDCGEVSEKAQLFNLIGLVYDQQKDSGKSLEMYFEALSIAKNIQDYSLQVSVLNNIALHYRDLSEITKCLDFLSEALFLAKEINDSVYQQIITRNLGVTFSKLQDFTAALAYHKESLSLSIELKNKDEELRILDEIDFFKTENNTK